MNRGAIGARLDPDRRYIYMTFTNAAETDNDPEAVVIIGKRFSGENNVLEKKKKPTKIGIVF